MSRRRIRRQNFNDSNDIIYPNEGEDYIDFKSYPLPINWKEIEDDDSVAYEVWDKFGYFGASLYTTLSSIEDLTLIKDEKLIKNVVDYFYSLFLEETSTSVNKLAKFIEKLPSLGNIKQLLSSNMIHRKELVLIKLVLDFYETYYSLIGFPIYSDLMNEYIPTATLFYSVLSEEDVEMIYECFSSCRDIFKVLKNHMNCFFSKKKASYLTYLKNKKSEKLMFSGGNISNLFIK